MGDEICRTCHYTTAGRENIARIEGDIKAIGAKVNTLEGQMASQITNTNTLFDLMREIKEVVSRIEAAVYTKEDKFQLAIFQLGMWSLKVGIGGGFVIWAVAKFGGGQ